MARTRDEPGPGCPSRTPRPPDRKSTRLNSSHANISYAVFCLKKKKKKFNSNHTNITHALLTFKKTYAQTDEMYKSGKVDSAHITIRDDTDPQPTYSNEYQRH